MPISFKIVILCFTPSTDLNPNHRHFHPWLMSRLQADGRSDRTDVLAGLLSRFKQRVTFIT